MSDNLEQCELLLILNLCHHIYHIGSVSCNNLLPGLGSSFIIKF